MRLILIVIWLCLLPMTGEAYTYYVETAANGGSDGNSGADWDNSWATISKVNSTVVEGDTVYFGTGIWYSSTLEPPTGGGTDDWTAYLDSTADSTTMYDTRIVAGDLMGTGWVQRGATAIYAHYKSITSESFCLSQNDSTMAWATSIGAMTAGTLFEDVTNDSVYAWCYGGIDPNTVTMVSGTRDKSALLVGAACKAIKVIGLHFSHGSDFTAKFERSAGTKGPDYINLDYCWVGHSGGSVGSNTGAFHSVQGGQSYSEFAQYNHFYRCKFGPCNGEGGQEGTNITTTYGLSESRFTECEIYGGGNGLYFKDQYGSAAHIGLAAVGCTIHDCLQSAIEISSHSDRDTIAGCFMYDCVGGPFMYGSSTTPYPGQTYLCFNTIYRMTETAGIKFSDASTSSGVCFGTNNKVMFNIVSACSNYMWIGIEDYAGQCTTFWDNMTWDGNLYYGNPGTNHFDATLLGCGEGDNWDHWHTTCGLDPNGSNTTDPDFHDAAGRDFTRDSYSILSDSVYIWPFWYVTQGAWTPRGYSEPPEPPEFTPIRPTANNNCLGSRGGLIQ